MNSFPKLAFAFVGALCASVLTASCASDDDAAGASAGPNAPSELTVSTVSGAAHLTWKDNASDETGFMVERMADPSTKWELIASLPANSMQYHDTTGITPGGTYMYRVMAMKDAAESGYTAEVSWTAP
jgi:hypothetical protein